MSSMSVPQRRWAFWAAAGAALVALALLLAGPRAGASMPFNPLFEFTAISSSAPGANADITFRTSLPAGHHILGDFHMIVPDNSWTVAGHSNQLQGDVTAVGRMTFNFDPDGNCNDGDSGSPQDSGLFPLVDIDPGGGGPHAIWGGTITDFGDGNASTSWGLQFIVEPFEAGYMINGAGTNILWPPPLQGNPVCTPQVFTLTMCGRANPTSTATVCGSGSNEVVMTNPSSAGCYVWTLLTDDESGAHTVTRQAGVPIGAASCPTPSPTPPPTPPPNDGDGDSVPDGSDNCPRWPNPAQNLPPWPVPTNDPDCDGFSTGVENSAGTDALVHCGADTWPTDITNNTFSDTGDIGALTGYFGSSVPPAPARYNIAPDPVDGFIDTGDIGRMTAFFALGCTPCAGDLDCDTVLNVSDNCPNWPNRAQSLPPWLIPVNDPDCDGFSTAVENSAGTNALLHCGFNAWPADITSNTFIDTGDLGLLTNDFGESVPPAAARLNIAPDPVDGFIDTGDIGRMTAFFGLSCS